MKNYILTLLEQEEIYAKRLAAFLGNHAGSPFDVQLFLEHPLPEEGRVFGDVILTASSLWNSYRDSFGESLAVLLDEDGTRREGAEFSVYKYQSAEVIYQSLLALCLDKLSRRILCGGIKGRHFEVQIFWYPVPDQRTAACVKQNVEKLAREKKTLYIDMQPVPAPTDKEETMAGESGFSDIIYYLKQYHENIGIRISSAVLAGKFDTIAPAQLSSEAFDMDPCDWENLFRVLGEETEYEVLVLDYGCSVPPAAVLEDCSVIEVFGRNSEWDSDRIRCFRQILGRIGGERLADKVRLHADLGSNMGNHCEMQ